MKRIFWMLTIRKRIKLAIKSNEAEKSFFYEQMLKSPLLANDARYLLSRIEIKKEVIYQLKRLL